MPFRCKSIVSAIALIAILTLPVTASAAKPPASVDDASSSVVQVIKTASEEKGAAFAIDDGGGFLTSQQVASRSAGLEIRLRGSTETYRANRVESDAPPGLVMLRAPGAPKVPALAFARKKAVFSDHTWVVPPSALGTAPRSGVVKLPERACIGGDDSGVLSISAARSAGINGSPVLDTSGRVVGVVRSSRSACAKRTLLQAVAATAAPRVLPTVAPPTPSNFPAVSVVAALFALLLLANLVFFFLRRATGAAAPGVSTQSGGPAGPPPAPRDDDDLGDDDLEITLKPRPSVG